MAKFECQKCGSCCHHWDIPIEVNIGEVHQWIKPVPFQVDRVMLRAYGKCGHLRRRDNKCRNYENRPQICRDFLCKVEIKGRVQ